MLRPTERQKLLHAIVFFAKNTRFYGKVKLFKLLYLLDFAHCRETGRSVTGLDYLAWRMGPVPLDVVQEWDQPEDDFAAAVEIVPERVIDHTRQLVRPRIEFDNTPFSKRELRIMQELADRYRDDPSLAMVNVTHLERGPWDKIWDNGRGNNTRIPYSLAIPDDDPNRDAILESAREYEGIAAANRH